MENLKPVLSTRELAEAIGVSESSIKRWADDGTVRAVRTIGGHRRIPFEEAIRFVRASNLRLVKPEVLGLHDVSSVQGPIGGQEEESRALYEFLHAGEADKARGLILSAYLNGRSVAQIVDGPLRIAMERIGQEWQHSPAGVFFEHRASEIVISAIHRLGSLITSPELTAPTAVGGAPPKDPYIVPSLAVSLVLRGAGMAATNLGPFTPATAFAAATRSLRARLLWLSISYVEDLDLLRDEVFDLLTLAEDTQATLIIGGRHHRELNLPLHPRLYLATSMAEVEAFVRGYAASRTA
jgi:MerR family transcriptional regulator, light-induced transcriptional regulator